MPLIDLRYAVLSSISRDRPWDSLLSSLRRLGVGRTDYSIRTEHQFGFDISLLCTSSSEYSLRLSITAIKH